MSTRHKYPRAPIYDSRPYDVIKYIPNNLNRFSLRSEFKDAEEDEEDCEVPESIASENTSEILKYVFRTEILESDQSLDESLSANNGELSPKAVVSRQLSYISLPDYLLLPDTQSAEKHQRPLSASPALSIESVAMELDTEDLFDTDAIPMEEVDDETVSLDEEDFVSVRVKVEKKAYPTKAVKVTVSVQPPSDMEEQTISIVSDMSEEEEVSVESDFFNEESENMRDEVDVDVETDVSSSSSIGSESASESASESDEEQTESSHSEESESEAGESSKSDHTHKSANVAIDEKEKVKTKLNSPEKEEVPKDTTEQMLNLLSAAIDDSEKSKNKIIQHVMEENKRLAEEAAAELERAAAAVTVAKAASSHMIKVKGLGESVVSGVQKAVFGVSNRIDKIISNGHKENGSAGDNNAAKQEVIGEIHAAEKYLSNVEKQLEGDFQKETSKGATEVVKTTAHEIDKRIGQEAGSLNEMINSADASLSSHLHPPSTSIPQKSLEKVEKITPPPPNSIVVADVTVHGVPPNSETPKTPQKLIADKSQSFSKNFQHTVNEQSNNILTQAMPKPDTSPVEKLASSSPGQIIVPVSTNEIVEIVPKPQNEEKFEEKDDYLSVYAADSMDSTDEEEDSILQKQKTQEETEKDREAVELAKDKLLEEWKTTRRQSVDDLDERFSHVLEDMVSELHKGPVVPTLPKELQEAVKVSEPSTDENTSKSGSSGKNENNDNEDTEHSSLENSSVKSEIASKSQSSRLSSESRCSNSSSSYQHSGSSRQSTSNSRDSHRSSINSVSTQRTTSNSSLGQRSCTNSSRSSATHSMQTYSDFSRESSSNSQRSSSRSTSSSPSISSSKTVISVNSSNKSTPNKLTPQQPKSSTGTQSKSPMGVDPNHNAEKPSSGSQGHEDYSSAPNSASKPISRKASNNSIKITSDSTITSDKTIITTHSNASIEADANMSKAYNIETTEMESENTKPLKPSASQQSLKASGISTLEVKNGANEVSLAPSQKHKSPSISQQSSIQTEQSMDMEHESDSLDEGKRNLPDFSEHYNLIPEVEDNTADSISRRSEESLSKKRKWKNSTEIASTLSHYLHTIKTETVEHCVTEIIPLLTHLLVKSRKNKTEHSLPTLIAALSAVRVLCERFHHVKVLSGERSLRNMDLSWLLRILCKLSADPNSKVRPEAGFTLARLVTASGPELITRPVYFLLVMENEGIGHHKGSLGSKTKAAALDTLTYALLTFPKEEFDDLEEITRWVCLVTMHPHRRVRQAALECIAVLGSQMGSPDAAVGRLRGLIIRESEQNYNRSDSDSSAGKHKNAIRTFDSKGIFDVSAITAISTRIRKRILPLPSPQGLVEYGVKVPTGQELVLILTKMQEEEEEEYEGSTSDSVNSSSSKDDFLFDDKSESESIRMSDLEKAATEERIFGKKPESAKEGKQNVQAKDLITPDVAYVLAGKGRVNTQEPVNDNEPASATQEDEDEEEKKKAKKKKKRKKREVVRTFSEYEDDSPPEED